VTFTEWYEAMAEAYRCSPRDLARAAFVAGRATMRDELEEHFAGKVDNRPAPVLSADMMGAIRTAPREALRSFHRGLLRCIVAEIGQRQAGGS
jgi:hypothetical protein